MLSKPNTNKPAFNIPCFVHKRELIENDKCTECEKDIKEEEFKDEISKREYSISGMCQKCQDKIFR
jgi:hypothetical protein